MGIIRVRTLAILTYNTGRNFEKQPLQPALALQALAGYVARTNPQQPAGA